MWHRLATALVAIAWSLACLAPGAHAQNSALPCDSFVKNSDNSWSALRNVPIRGMGESLTVREGSVLRPGAAIKGLDLATMLDEQCPVAPEPVVQSAAPAPKVALGRYADANGNIDAQNLNCGQLADASPEEVDLFLTWYSGWYSGLAKKRGINLARIRNASRLVIDYCKGNRDKKITQVMDLMLK